MTWIVSLISSAVEMEEIAVVEWSGIQRVDPQMIHFELVCHPVRRSQFNPQIIFV